MKGGYFHIGNIDLAYIKKNLLGEARDKGFLDNLNIEGYEPFDVSSNENDIYLDYASDAIENLSGWSTVSAAVASPAIPTPLAEPIPDKNTEQLLLIL